MSLTSLKAAIVTALGSVTSLQRVYDQWPENINETPCALVLPKTGQFQLYGGRNMKHNLEVVVLVKRAGDLEQGQEDLDSFLDDSTGTDSICYAVENTTGYSVRVVGYRDYGGLEYPPGSGNVYLGVRFDVESLA